MAVEFKTNANDITSLIHQMKSQTPTISVQKKLQEVLSELFSKAGIKDPTKGVNFRMPDGTTLSFKEFYAFVIKTNNVMVIPKIKELCKDSAFMKEVITFAGENANNLSKDQNAKLIEITFDLGRTKGAQIASKDGTSNIAVGQAAVNAQDISRANRRVSEKDNASTVDEKESGSLVVYKEEWLLSVLMDKDKLGYEKAV